MEDFLLQLNPTDCIVFIDRPSKEELVNSTIRISNPSQYRCAVKVKCTNNELFLIQPPFGILDPEQTGSVNIAFKRSKEIPESGKHYVVVYYIKVNEDQKKAREFWKEHQGDPHGIKRLYIHFEKEDKHDKENNEEKEDIKRKKTKGKRCEEKE